MKRRQGDLLVKSLRAIQTIVQMRVSHLRRVSVQMKRLQDIPNENQKSIEALKAQYTKRG